ncbi:MAG: peptidylprolyl isomerase, partial [Acidimicrobiia bacterium]
IEEVMGRPGATEAHVRFNAYMVTLSEQARDGVASDEPTLRQALAGGVEVTTVCARHILVATQEEAGQVAGRLGDGEDFAAVAAEVSLDSAPDGELGCNQASLFVPSFAEAAVAAPLGEIVGPVPTQFGWHLLIVDERRTPTFEELQADPRAFLSDRLVEALWVEWLNATLAAADVEIVPRYGTWTPATPWVLPPDNDTR